MYKQFRKFLLTILLSISKVSNPIKRDDFIDTIDKRQKSKLKDEFLLGLVNGELSEEMLNKHYSIVKEIDDTKHVKYVKKTFSSFDENNNLIKYTDFVPVLMNDDDIKSKSKKHLEKLNLNLEEGYILQDSFNPVNITLIRSTDFKPIINIIDYTYLVVIAKNNNDHMIEFYCDSYDHSLMNHLYGSNKEIEIGILLDKFLFDKISIPYNLHNLISNIVHINIGEKLIKNINFHSIKKLNKSLDDNYRFIIKFNFH